MSGGGLCPRGVSVIESIPEGALQIDGLNMSGVGVAGPEFGGGQVAVQGSLFSVFHCIMDNGYMSSPFPTERQTRLKTLPSSKSLVGDNEGDSRFPLIQPSFYPINSISSI